MAPIRLGIIGCGIAARDLHWPALKELTRKFRITCVCNRTEPKARSFAELVGGVPYVLDHRELLAREEVDAVDIILPIDLNGRVAGDALRAGKHVMVEKPLAATVSEARALVRLASKSPVVSMVAENFHYRRGLRKLKALLEDGRIGTVYTAIWTGFIDITPATNKYARIAWRLRHKYPGGFTMDGGIHFAHAIRYLFGEVRSVATLTRRADPTIGDVDTHLMQFETESGVAGIFANCYSARGLREDRLVILGSQGSISFEGGRILLRQTGKAERVLSDKDSRGYVEQFEDFHRAITRGTSPEMTFEEGCRDFELIATSLEAARSGKRLTLRGKR